MYFKALGVLLVLGMAYGAYYFVTSMQNELIEAHKANTKYALVVEELKFSMEGIQDDIMNDRARIDKAYEGMKENKKKVDGVTKMLSRHDLEKIIQRKPQWFEKIAQKGTDKYYAELEELSKWSEQ